MGRKSVAAEKRVQIVEAFCDCIVDLGIDAASMGEVASRVGIDRSTMHYYYKTREALVVEASQHIASFYVDRIVASVSKLNPADKARSLIEFLFGPSFHDERRSALLDELSTLGNRQPFFQEQVRTVYAKMEEVVLGVFIESLPGAPEKECAELVYAIMALAEGAAVHTSLGFGKSHRLVARRLALRLLDEQVAVKVAA